MKTIPATKAIAEARVCARVARDRANVPGGTHNPMSQDFALAEAVDLLAAVCESLVERLSLVTRVVVESIEVQDVRAR
jgi:hypothetical protein